MAEDNGENIRNWAELEPDVLAEIFRKLKIQDMFMRVPLVCWSWNKASFNPVCWEVVDLREWVRNIFYDVDPEVVERMVKTVVDRSCGQLKGLFLCSEGTDSMLEYIADRCSSLKYLQFSHSYNITDSTFCKVAYKFPMLEILDISGCDKLSKLALQEIGQCCKALKCLRRCGSSSYFTVLGNSPNDEEALTVATSMPHLKRLEMKDTQISNEGLAAILEGCRELEYLDVSRCQHLIIDKTTSEKCSKLKVFHISLDKDDWDDPDDYNITNVDYEIFEDYDHPDY